jgi:hypothetical protein
MFCLRVGIVIGQVSSKNWIKKLPHESKNWVDVKASHSIKKFDMLVRIYKNSKIAKDLDINTPPRFIKCYQDDIINNPTNS